MLINPIDPAPYARSPRLGADTGLSLSKMLLTVVPKKPGPGIIMTAKMLAGAVTTVETIWNSHGKPKVPSNARPADLRVDRGWNAVYSRLTAWAIFPEDDPQRQTADALTRRLFETGLDFLKLNYLAQHAQCERRLQIIEAEGLRDDLDHLVGKPFMNELLAAHAAYGEALGITKPKETAAPKDLLIEPLRALGDTIVAYSLQVIAFAALSPDNLAAARRALAPIDEFRAAASRRAATNGSPGARPETDDFARPEGAPAPDAPMPELPSE